MKHITKEDALRALEEAVAEKGEDYRYNTEDGCAYVDWDGCEQVPSCIAGNALHRLGVPLNDLFEYNRGWGVWSVVDKLHLTGDADAWTALGHAQSEQDAGLPWGTALESARRAVTPDA